VLKDIQKYIDDPMFVPNEVAKHNIAAKVQMFLTEFVLTVLIFPTEFTLTVWISLTVLIELYFVLKSFLLF
jgi:hypothetical protein